MNIPTNFINQINESKRIHDELFKQLEGISTNPKPSSTTPSELYKRNKQEYYALVSSMQEFEQFMTKNKNEFTSQEWQYFTDLFSYSQTLIKLIRFFPTLTYTLWQNLEKKHLSASTDNSFSDDLETYLQLRNDSIEVYERLKEFTYA